MNSAAREGWLERQETAEALVLSLGGRWDMRCAERHEKELRHLTMPRGQTLRIDFSAIESLDTAGAWLVHRLAKRLRDEGIGVDFANFPAAHADILERLAHIDSHIEINRHARTQSRRWSPAAVKALSILASRSSKASLSSASRR
jgi:anti-anti-sigma regulatory factor